MSRRVAVELVLEAARYLFGVRNIAAETKAAAEEFKSLGGKVDGTSRDIEELSVVIIAGKKELEGFGDHTKELGLDLELLDRRIDATKRKMALLALEFAATGDAAAGKGFQSQRSMLAKLEALKAELESGSTSPERRLFDLLLPNEDDGRKAGTKVAAGFGDAFKDLPIKGPLIGGLIEAIALALPLIGGMIAGAISGAIGTGGIAGGIFAASKDPVVRSAAQDFMQHISTEFFGSGSAFVDPIRESLGILQNDFDKLDLGSAFAKVAPDVTIIASGIGDLVTKSMPGLNKALDRMEPFAKAAAEGFGEIGNALGGLADDATKSHGALQGLELMFHVISGTIAATGKIVLWLSDRLQNINEFIEWSSRKMLAFATALGLPHDNLQKFVDELDAFNKGGAKYTADTAKMLGDAFAGSAASIEANKQAILDNQNAFNDWINNALGLADANTAVAQDFADLNDNLKKGKKYWDDNTQGGRDNGTEIRRVIADLERQRQQAIATSDGSQDAIDAINRKFNDLVDQLDKTAIKAGATKDALDKMAGDYHITIVTDIITAATAARASKTDKSQAKKGYASGGDPLANDWAWVGEQGPELVKFGPGAHVFTSAQSNAMAGQWSSAPASSGQIVVQNQITMIDPMTGAKTRGILITEATSRGVSSSDAKAAYP